MRIFSKEFLPRLPEISHLPRYVIGFGCAIIFSLQLNLPVEAQNRPENQALPGSCYRENGYLDLAKCSTNFLRIPQSDLIHGFYDEAGTFVPNLPSEALHNFDAGLYLTGNMEAMSKSQSRYLLRTKSAKWGLDASKFVGVFAADSCRYVNTAVFVRKSGTQDPWVGPLLVGDCAAYAHQYGRAVRLQTVGEVDKTTHDQFQDHGEVYDLEFVFQSSDNLTPPPIDLDASLFINYTDAWLTAGKYR